MSASTSYGIRFTAELWEQVKKAADADEANGASAWVRQAVNIRLRQDAADSAALKAEKRTALTLLKLSETQQATIAYLDALVKMLVSVLPEATPTGRAQGKLRYERFMATVRRTYLDGDPVPTNGVAALSSSMSSAIAEAQDGLI